MHYPHIQGDETFHHAMKQAAKSGPQKKDNIDALDVPPKGKDYTGICCVYIRYMHHAYVMLKQTQTVINKLGQVKIW